MKKSSQIKTAGYKHTFLVRNDEPKDNYLWRDTFKALKENTTVNLEFYIH